MLLKLRVLGDLCCSFSIILSVSRALVSHRLLPRPGMDAHERDVYGAAAKVA